MGRNTGAKARISIGVQRGAKAPLFHPHLSTNNEEFSVLTSAEGALYDL